MRTGRPGLPFAYTGLGLVFTPVAIFCAIWSGGAGHGSYVVFRLLYPYLFLLMACNVTGGWFFVWMGIQFLCYGVLLDTAAAMRLRKSSMGFILGVVHGAAVAVCFSGLIPEYPYSALGAFRFLMRALYR